MHLDLLPCFEPQRKHRREFNAAVGVSTTILNCAELGWAIRPKVIPFLDQSFFFFEPAHSTHPLET